MPNCILRCTSFVSSNVIVQITKGHLGGVKQRASSRVTSSSVANFRKHLPEGTDFPPLVQPAPAEDNPLPGSPDHGPSPVPAPVAAPKGNGVTPAPADGGAKSDTSRIDKESVANFWKSTYFKQCCQNIIT